MSKAKTGGSKKAPPPKGVVNRFSYHGPRAVAKGYMLHFSGHRSDFPTSEDAHFLLEVQTDQSPEKWDADWWPVAFMKAFGHFRYIAVEDIKGTPLAGLPGGIKQ